MKSLKLMSDSLTTPHAKFLQLFPSLIELSENYIADSYVPHISDLLPLSIPSTLNVTIQPSVKIKTMNEPRQLKIETLSVLGHPTKSRYPHSSPSAGSTTLERSNKFINSSASLVSTTKANIKRKATSVSQPSSSNDNYHRKN